MRGTTRKPTTALDDNQAALAEANSLIGVFDGSAFDRAVALCIDKGRSVWNQHYERTEHARYHGNSPVTVGCNYPPIAGRRTAFTR